MLQVHAPTGVTHCAAAHFTQLDAKGNLPDLVVTTSSLLQLYSIRLASFPEPFPTSVRSISSTREGFHHFWLCRLEEPMQGAAGCYTGLSALAEG